MQDFLELSVSAAASGCIYALVALAYLLMIRPTGIINFAVGEWAMVAAFGAFLFFSRIELPYPIGMAAILAFMLFVGWATERIAVRPLVERGAPLLAPILALLGMLVVFRESISLGFGPDPHQVPEPVAFEVLKYFMIGTTLVVFAMVWLFFEKTAMGRAFEAVSLNRKAAALVGVNLSRVTAASFAGNVALSIDTTNGNTVDPSGFFMKWCMSHFSVTSVAALPTAAKSTAADSASMSACSAFERFGCC